MYGTYIVMQLPLHLAGNLPMVDLHLVQRRSHLYQRGPERVVHGGNRGRRRCRRGQLQCAGTRQEKQYREEQGGNQDSISNHREEWCEKARTWVSVVVHLLHGCPWSVRCCLHPWLTRESFIAAFHGSVRCCLNSVPVCGMCTRLPPGAPCVWEPS